MTMKLLVEGVVSTMIDEALSDLDVAELVGEAVSSRVDIDDEMAEKVKEMVDNADLTSTVEDTLNDSGLEDQVTEALENQVKGIVEDTLNDSGLEDQVTEALENQVKGIVDRLVESLDVKDLIEAAVQRKLQAVLSKV